VRDAGGQAGADEDRGEGFAVEGEADLGRTGGGAVGRVCGECLLELLEARGRVMEAGDGFCERWLGQIREQGLEAAEGLGCAKGLLGGLDLIEGASAGDESVSTPDIAFRIDVEGLTGAGGDEAEDAAVAVGVRRGACGELGGEVCGDALDVAHERDGVTEDVVIDALNDGPLRRGAGGGGDAEGVIDVAGAPGVGGDEGAGNLEGRGDGGEVVRRGHAQRRSG